MGIRLMKANTYEEMSRKAANLIAGQIALKPTCVLGLATGSTPEGLYRELVAMHKAGDVDFASVRSVNLDEYKGLAPSNDQSYRTFMQKNLFDHVNIKPENTNVPNGLATNGDAECARYDALIEALGGIDLQLLGIGHNGHIGFNEPADAFVLPTNCVNLTASTIQANKRFFAKEEDVPRQAFTMGIAAIMRAKRVLVVASGSGKAEIIKRAFFGPVTPQVPASILQLHPNVIVAGDAEAMALV